MGQIKSLFVWKVIRQVDDSLDKRSLLQSVGVDPDAPVDHSLMLPASAYYAYLERIAELDPHAVALPLKVGDSMRCDEYGAFGLAWKSAQNLRGSFERAQRYARVLTSVTTYEVREADEGVYMHLHRHGERRRGLCMSNEASIAAVASISQQVSTERFRPLAVYFKHPAPGSTATHEQHFGCPVYFDSASDGLLVSKETAERTNRLWDAGISKFFDTHLDSELAHYDGDASLEQKVRIQISQCLSEGIPKVSEIARRLGMSARTLQRRLTAQGASFQTLVDESQRQLAERLLMHTDYPLAQVAFLTGFSDQSAFNRSFKRWAGKTPGSFRRRETRVRG